jgi:hypothetical protein
MARVFNLISSYLTYRNKIQLFPKSLFDRGQKGVWYDPSDITTLFQDTAGSVPVTTPGQTVALMLDKSRGLVLGPELVTNGTFDADLTGWNTGSGATITRDTAIFPSGGLLVTASGGTASFSSTTVSGLVAGKRYVLSADMFTPSGQDVSRATIGFQSGSFNLSASLPQTVLDTIQTLTLQFTAISSSQIVYLSVVTENFAQWGQAGSKGYFDNISVREVPGNHATQAITASRPAYGIMPKTGRRNLLLRTEEFDNAYWGKLNATITANAAADPTGKTTADLIVENSATAAHGVQILGAFVVGTTRVATIYAKAGTRSRIAFGATTSGGVVGNQYICVDLTDGSTLSVSEQGGSVEGAGGGWYRITLAARVVDASSDRVAVNILRDSDTVPTSYAGDGTSGLYLWGAQGELGSTATPYQRVGTALDVTEAGKRSVGYLSFDGIGDSMVTPTITPGTDKVQVFAGVRKLSDAARRVIAELSASIASNDGAFALMAPNAASATFAFESKGTSLTDAVDTGIAAPATRVLTGLGDIVDDTTTLRINGTQEDQDTGDQGTGNYLAYPLYIGARAGTSLFFNGHLYSLIVSFGPNLGGTQIGNIERYVASNTPGVSFVAPTIDGLPEIGVI